MKKQQKIILFPLLLLVISSFFFTACGGERKRSKVAFSPGENVFVINRCNACHQVKTISVGPSLKDISLAYKNNKDGLKLFLKEEADAIVDPDQADIMQPQLLITKNLSDKDLSLLVDYILKQ